MSTVGEAGHGTQARGRRQAILWRLAVAGLVLIVISLVPPFGTLARRYIFLASLQFSLFALVVPALVVLAAPWRFLRLSRGGDGPATAGTADAGTAEAGTGPADRLAVARRQQTSFARAIIFLVIFVGVTVFWRLPAVMSALASTPGLAVIEMVTLMAAGIGLWLELVESPPLAPRLPRPQRAALAAFTMWSIWIPAYILGMSITAVVHGYDPAGGGLSVIADQELTVGLLWLVAGLCFIPVVFTTALSWLKDGEDPDEELQRVVRDAHQRVAVPGWDRHARSGKPLT